MIDGCRHGVRIFEGLINRTPANAANVLHREYALLIRQELRSLPRELILPVELLGGHFPHFLFVSG